MASLLFSVSEIPCTTRRKSQGYKVFRASLDLPLKREKEKESQQASGQEPLLGNRIYLDYDNAVFMFLVLICKVCFCL